MNEVSNSVIMQLKRLSPDIFLEQVSYSESAA